MKQPTTTLASYVGLFFGLFMASVISLVGAFYLLAIAFHASFDKLRGEFIPIYMCIMVGLIISSLVSRRWPYAIATVAILFPVITLAWIALQSFSFGIDAVLLIASSYAWSYCAANFLITKKEAEQGAAGNPLPAE